MRDQSKTQGGFIRSGRPFTDQEMLDSACLKESVMRSAMCGKAEPAHETLPEIPEKLSRIENLLCDVRQMIETVDARIGPVLASSSPSASNLADAVRGCRSGLGGVLEGFANQLEMMQTRLSDMTYRIQL